MRNTHCVSLGLSCATASVNSNMFVLCKHFVQGNKEAAKCLLPERAKPYQGSHSLGQSKFPHTSLISKQFSLIFFFFFLKVELTFGDKFTK